MTIVACLLAIALVATILLSQRHQARLQDAWTVERRELLNRIQRPEAVPYTPNGQYVIPDREPDEIDMVGQVHLDPTWDPDEPVGILPDPD